VRSTDSFGINSAWITSTVHTVDNTLPPEITTTTPSDIGTVSNDFAWQYVVTQPDNETTTVVERVNGVSLRSYTAVLGDTQTFDVSGMRFMTVLNGPVTMTATATAANGKYDVLTVTATKRVVAATITLANPLTSVTNITKLIMSITGSIPSDSDYQVLVTNDGTTWTDVTNNIINHTPFNFGSVGQAFNFQVSVTRGLSDIGGYISTIGGSFE
jgi:hypothetical protein